MYTNKINKTASKSRAGLIAWAIKANGSTVTAGNWSAFLDKQTGFVFVTFYWTNLVAVHAETGRVVLIDHNNSMSTKTGLTVLLDLDTAKRRELSGNLFQKCVDTFRADGMTKFDAITAATEVTK